LRATAGRDAGSSAVGSGTRSEGKERVFSEYLRRLAESAEPDGDLFDRVLRLLRGALRRELRRRGLWEAPPSFLGVVGGTSWRDEGLLDELTHACYGYNFVERLRPLIAQLQVKDNVDGLVFRNVRNFVYELQRDHDPLGHRAWEVVRTAVDVALAEGWVFVAEEGKAVDHDCVLSLAAEADPWLPDDPLEAARRQAAVEALAALWNADLLPDLVTARGRARHEVAAKLARRLPELVGEGVTVLRFRDLLDPLRRDLRQRWAALFWEARGAEVARGQVETTQDADVDASFTRVLLLYQPAPAPDEAAIRRLGFRALTDCIAREVEARQEDGRLGSYLSTLWQFLRTCAGTPDPMPSQRKLARFLHIPRDRLPELHEILGEMVQRCQRRLAGLAARGAVARDPEGGEEER